MNDVPYIRQWRSSLFALFILSIFSTMAVAESPLWSATQTNDFSKEKILVKLKSNANASALVNIYNDIGVLHVKTFQNSGISLLEITDQNKTVDEILESLNKYDQVVEYAEPDYMMQIDSIPNDPKFGQLWGLHNTGQSGGTNDADIDASEAWNKNTDSSVVVGIIDTGIDYNHEDLAANIWVNPNEIAGNGIDDDNNGYIDDVHGINAINDGGDPMDDQGHGTHVSGTIGGVGNNGIGVTGVNWNVKMMGLKFLDKDGSGWSSDAIKALEYAIMMKTQHNVNIKLTSNSWGGGGSSQAMRDAIEASQNAGMLFIAAAGNSGTDNDANPHYPSSYDLLSVIAVASTDRNDNLSSFSCFGANSVDLAAPGSDILSSTPGNQYASYSGTSMATPHVAGAAALLWAANPSYSYAEIKAKLMSSVDQLAGLSGKMISGGRLNINIESAAGSLQFSQATYSVNEGAGSATITVSRTGGSDGSVSVNYTINDGTATSGNDYSGTPGTLTWNDGNSTSKLITVNIIDDNNQESSENFSLVLSNATGDATIGSPNNTVVTITDNDSGSDCPHASFSVADKKITIPMLDMPLLDSLTGEPNGNIAVLQAELEMTEGVGDFKMIPESVAVIAGEEPNAECHASYSYNTRIMHLPFVDVSSTIVLPPNIVIDGPIQVFEANLQQLQLYNEIFHLKDYTYLYELE
jgi:subtilisin family serine protease